MKQRTALLLAAALTAFVLVLVGGVAAHVAQSAAPATAPATATTASDPTADPAVQDAIRQRDAQIQQANERLQQAYEQLQQQPGQSQAAQVATADSETSGYAVSPKMAAAIAFAAAPGTTLSRAPELVDFQGIAAYEVRLNRGLVYVDAGTGKVLYNGAAPAFGAFFGHEGGEHEAGEHEWGGPEGGG